MPEIPDVTKDPRRVIGYLGRAGIMAARLRRLEEEHVREPGWIRRQRKEIHISWTGSVS